MKFRLTDYFEYYKTEAVFYCIEIFPTPLTEQDFFIIVEKLKYYCRKKHISWLAVFSDTDSNDAEQVIDRLGKVGRPKKRVQGTKIDGHIHAVVIGDKSTSANKTACQIKDSINKRYKNKVSRIVPKGNSAHGYNFVQYCMRQANIIRTGGDFDFRDYVENHTGFG